MTQTQILNLLDSIMGDISSSNDPAGTMLKCARTHNLAPAQLQKLAQVFNTTKTIVALKQASNRGDSFSLVDPDKIVASYTTYSPDAQLSGESKKVHKTVDKLLKAASTPMTLSEWESKNMRDALCAGGVFYHDDSHGDQFTEIAGYKPPYDIEHTTEKSASVCSGDSSLRREDLKQAVFDASMDLSEKLAALKTKFAQDDGQWAEAVEDMVDRFGAVKIASTIAMIEDYFDTHGLMFKAANLETRRYKRAFVEDRHNVFETAEELMGIVEKQAAARKELAELEKAAVSTAKPEDEAKADQDKDDLFSTPDGAAQQGDLGIHETLPEGADVSDDGKNLLSTPTPVSQQGSPVDSTAATLLAGMHRPFVAAPKTSLLDAVKAFKGAIGAVGGADNGQAKIDAAVDNAKRETTFNQLILSDPYLSSQDPQEVRELYDLIASHSPMYATEPRLMAPVLKEALQYKSIPVQQLKELLSAQKTDLEVKKLQNELNNKK